MAAIVEVVVGVIFVYILLSILVTEINTLISNAFRLRAQNLREALDKIIEDPVMRAKIYTHPLIQLVEDRAVLPTQRISAEDAADVANGVIAAVDWIDSQTFVDVVLNNIKVESDQELFGALFNVIDGMPSGPERRGLRLIVNRIVSSGDGMDELREAIHNVDQESFRNALNETLSHIDEEISQMGLEPNSIVSVMAGIRQIDNPYFRNALSTIMATATTLDEAKYNIEKWFDNSMSRASTTFASKMKTLSIAVALIIAVLVNVDSLHLARTLWEDPILRQQLSAAATTAVTTGEIEAMINEANQGAMNAVSGTATSNVLDDLATSSNDVVDTIQDIQDLRLPVGWLWQGVDETVAPDHPARFNPSNIWNYFPWNNPNGWLGLLFAKILGLAVTIISASQGAPFWFNILNKIVAR